MEENYKHKYCIIGAGLAGLGVAKHLKTADIPFDMIEREDTVGGNWSNNPSSKMYRSTHIISSKMNTQFSDFPMPESYPAYPSHSLMFDYIKSLVEHFKLSENILLQTTVESIVPVGNLWDVALSNGEVRRYKGVIVANGLLREPRYPSYAKDFTGESIHAVEYKDPQIFRGKNVLIIGAGNSGCDIAVDAASTAKNVYHSTRRGYHYMPKFINGLPTQEWLMSLSNDFKDSEELSAFVERSFKFAGFCGADYGLPVPDHKIFECHPIMNSMILYYIGHGDVKPKPDVKEINGKVVEFTDGSKTEVDFIVYATGYKMSFPFISKELLPWKSDSLPDLYVNCFHKHYDNLIFVGYVNSPSGFGNIMNVFGSTLVAYLKGLDRDSQVLKTFSKLKLEEEPYLGRDKFISSDRHVVEMDLWLLLNFLNKFRSTLENEAGGSK